MISKTQIESVWASLFFNGCIDIGKPRIGPQHFRLANYLSNSGEGSLVQARSLGHHYRSIIQNLVIRTCTTKWSKVDSTCWRMIWAVSLSPDHQIQNLSLTRKIVKFSCPMYVLEYTYIQKTSKQHIIWYLDCLHMQRALSMWKSTLKPTQIILTKPLALDIVPREMEVPNLSTLDHIIGSHKMDQGDGILRLLYVGHSYLDA